MKNYLVVLAKPKAVKEICIWSGEEETKISYKTEVILSGMSEDNVVHKVGRLYGDVAILRIKEIKL